MGNVTGLIARLAPLGFALIGVVWILSIGTPDDWRAYAVLGFAGAVVLGFRA